MGNVGRRVGLTLLGLTLSSAVLAAPRAELWEAWTKHDPASTKTVDHRPWAAFLDRYLITRSTIHRVDYRAVTADDRDRLEGYLTALTRTQVSRLSRETQLPFWINLYNALTIQVVLEHYPVESIKDIDISPGLFSFGPWDKKLVAVEGREISLNDIEHRILRPIWRDPRIHYTVNCASLGCPNLQAVPYTEKNTETLLEKGAREYINHPRGVSIENGDLVVSSIYVWFEEDFGGSEAGVIDHLLQYARPDLKLRLQGFRDIDDHRYNWALNEPEGFDAE
jgi:hypothetical protein